MKIETLLVHGAVDGDVFTGSVNVPIYQTSTYKQQGLGEYKCEYPTIENATKGAL